MKEVQTLKAYQVEIQGMGCMSCVRGVTAALESLGAEVRACEIGRADIRYDGDLEAIRTAVEARGFDVTAITEM